MAALGQTGVTINQMKTFGLEPTLSRMVYSAQFLHRELPIRYAVRLRELELAPLWMQNPYFRQVRK